ncbi:MAG: hypothetical protein QOI39_4199, partial [Mycobacterium sp.]|nr:hypothetical protein [Mycobacterium sp.]
MRRLVSLSLVALAIPAMAVALPVVTAPRASAHPVAPLSQHIAIPVTAVPAFNAATARGPLATVPSRSTKEFRAVGLSWRHTASLTLLTAEIRVHAADGWTDWQSIDTTDIGADNNADANRSAAPGVLRDGTDPLWVDRADGVEARIDSFTGPTPQDLRVDLIDPGSSPADATVATSPPVQSARADAAQPAILTRAAWGADENLRLSACPDGPQYTGTPKVAFVHHTVTGNGYAPGDVPAIIRSIYAFHVQGEGWCDVGYNFLVDRFGRIWEGRYGGIDRAVLGAHTGGFNTNSFGVSMIGTFDTAVPPQPMVDAMSQLIAWKLALSYANPLAQATMTTAAFSQVRFPVGTQVSLNVISGHRDADMTACPGNVGYSLLPQIRQQVLQDMGAGLVNPARVVTSPRTVGGNGSVHVAAGMLFTGDWQLLVQDASGNTVHTTSGQGQGLDTTWDMTADGGAPVPAGVYTLTLSSTQNGQTARPWTSTVVVGGVFGAVEGSSGSTGQVSVRGWAARGADTAPAQLNVTVDGVVAGTASTSLSRPDVAAVYPQYGDLRGFQVSEPATPGYHTVCVVGMNDDLGLPNTTLGCIGAVVPGLVSGQAVPRGHLEIAWPATGAVQVGGWALDADTTDPITVHIYVDGAFRAAIPAAGNRPDVGAAFPGMGDAHGFGAFVTGFYGGVHTVCAYAINAGGGVNPQLGCAKVTLGGGNPRGSLDVAQAVPGTV